MVKKKSGPEEREKRIVKSRARAKEAARRSKERKKPGSEEREKSGSKGSGEWTKAIVAARKAAGLPASPKKGR